MRRLARQLAVAGRSLLAATPVAECAILYSAEADLLDRRPPSRRGRARRRDLAQLHVQAPVVPGAGDAPPEAVIVLADAVGVTPLEAKEVRRRLEAGGGVLAFGEAAGTDEGRPGAPFLPGGKPAGVRVGRGSSVPAALAPEKGSVSLDAALLDRALAALLGKGRRRRRSPRGSPCWSSSTDAARRCTRTS